MALESIGVSGLDFPCHSESVIEDSHVWRLQFAVFGVFTSAVIHGGAGLPKRRVFFLFTSHGTVEPSISQPVFSHVCSSLWFVD